MTGAEVDRYVGARADFKDETACVVGEEGQDLFDNVPCCVVFAKAVGQYLWNNDEAGLCGGSEDDGWR